MMRALADGLLTYWLHSSVLLGLAALVCMGLRQRQLGLQETLLRAALVAGVFSASLQAGLGLRPVSGVLTLGSAQATSVPMRAAQAPRPETTWPTPALHDTNQPTRGNEAPAAASWTRGPSVAERIAALAPAWPLAFTGAWGLLALLALLRLASAARHLRALLRDRRPLAGTEVNDSARSLALRLGLTTPVRLSLAPRLDVPLARGLWRPEVCLPARTLSELGEDERTALCAHELAHVARRDPAWLLLARLIEALAPLQPLNLWARRRLQDVAECLSDDLAVQACARPLGLARCLVDVATWTVARPPLNPVAVARASGVRSHLGHRVERLMDDLRPLERSRRLLLPLFGAVALATAVVPPVLSAGAPRASSMPPLPPLAAPARPATPGRPAAVPAQPTTPAPLAAPLPVEAPEAEPTPAVAPEAAEVEDLDDASAAAGDVDEGQLEGQAEALAQRDAERQARLAERQARLQQRAEQLHARLAPKQEQLAALAAELGRASSQLARAKDQQERAAQREEIAQLQRALRAQADSMRVPRAELEAFAREARALAEQARPSEAALQALRREAQRTALDARGLGQEVRAELREAREELMRAAEELRRAAETLREHAARAVAPESH
jgi:beta-lactamase regulating signal transducer with metallopeptidase domain